MPEIPEEIVEKLFRVNQQMKASGMRELSDGELRLYAMRLMNPTGGLGVQGISPPAMDLLDRPGNLNPDQATSSIFQNPVSFLGDYAPGTLAPGSLGGRRETLEA